jgi:hypothetical protein
MSLHFILAQSSTVEKPKDNELSVLFKSGALLDCLPKGFFFLFFLEVH